MSSDDVPTLSLFANDPFRRILNSVKLAKDRKVRYVILLPIVFLLSWLVPFLLCLYEHHLVTENILQSFLYAPSPSIETIVFLLLLIAEPIIDEHIANAGHNFSDSGILNDHSIYTRLARQVARLHEAVFPEIILFALACLIVVGTQWASLQERIPRWDVDVVGGHAQFTIAGWWCAIVRLPLWQYIWLRWIWKFAIWVSFLIGISKAKLQLPSGHPDQCGGLGFLGKVQASFGTLIFAMGMVLAANVYRQIVQEHISSWNVAGGVVSFAILAPIVFLSPLFLFTRQLYLVKQEGLTRYEILLTQFIHRFETGHLPAIAGDEKAPPTLADLAAISSLETLHSHVSRMRIVPFDLESLIRLLISTGAPVLSLIVSELPWPAIRELLNTILR